MNYLHLNHYLKNLLKDFLHLHSTPRLSLQVMMTHLEIHHQNFQENLNLCFVQSMYYLRHLNLHSRMNLPQESLSLLFHHLDLMNQEKFLRYWCFLLPEVIVRLQNLDLTLRLNHLIESHFRFLRAQLR